MNQRELVEQRRATVHVEEHETMHVTVPSTQKKSFEESCWNTCASLDKTALPNVSIEESVTTEESRTSEHEWCLACGTALATKNGRLAPSGNHLTSIDWSK